MYHSRDKQSTRIIITPREHFGTRDFHSYFEVDCHLLIVLPAIPTTVKPLEGETFDIDQKYDKRTMTETTATETAPPTESLENLQMNYEGIEVCLYMPWHCTEWHLH